MVDLESGKREPHEATLTVMLTELAAAGINFTETGVEFRQWPPNPYVPTGIKQKEKRKLPAATQGEKKSIKNLTIRRKNS